MTPLIGGGSEKLHSNAMDESIVSNVQKQHVILNAPVDTTLVSSSPTSTCRVFPAPLTWRSEGC